MPLLIILIRYSLFFIYQKKLLQPGSWNGGRRVKYCRKGGNRFKTRFKRPYMPALTFYLVIVNLSGLAFPHTDSRLKYNDCFGDYGLFYGTV